MRAQMTRALTWLRLGGAFAITASFAAAVQGCGSSAGTGEPSKDGGVEDASAADGTTTVPMEAGPAADDSASGSDAATFVDAGNIDAGTPCDPDASAEIDCTGQCGPVTNACTGAVKMCGGCMPATLADGGTEARVCDLTTNTCVKPKVTCAELGAQCGTVRDSCGDFLDCPDTSPKGCAAGQQCNTDTNTCEACETVTCADLGYECGFAWLGCGPNTESNYTDCGSCPPSADVGVQVCNAVFNNCEPNCTAPSAAVVCAAAQAASGVNCGFISNGCGGIVDCDNVPASAVPTARAAGSAASPTTAILKRRRTSASRSGERAGTSRAAARAERSLRRLRHRPGVQLERRLRPPCAAMTCADYAQYACGTFSDGLRQHDHVRNLPGRRLRPDDEHMLPGQAMWRRLRRTVRERAARTAADRTPIRAHARRGRPAPRTGRCAASRRRDAGRVLHAARGDVLHRPEPVRDQPSGRVRSYDQRHVRHWARMRRERDGQPRDPRRRRAWWGRAARAPIRATSPRGPAARFQDSCRAAGTTYSCNKCTAGTQCDVNTCCTPAPACTGGGGAGGECNDTKQPVTAGCGSARTCTCTGSLVSLVQ